MKQEKLIILKYLESTRNKQNKQAKHTHTQQQQQQKSKTNKLKKTNKNQNKKLLHSKSQHLIIYNNK
jgi:hypothetical protein